MTDRERVKKGLECCSQQRGGPELCEQCPYYNESFACSNTLLQDALALLREYDTALKLMVFQYCTYEEGFYNRFMSAGEEAFRVLGIENGQSTNGVWEKWFSTNSTNKRGEDDA